MKRCYCAITVLPVLLFGCARPPQHDDILRIRPEVASQWRSTLRDTLYGGYFVRGTALELWIRPNERGGHDTIVLFRPATAGAEQEIWHIPVSQLLNVARRFGLDTGQYGGWNVVETYAVTERIPTVRSIPVRARDCDCLPLGFALPGLGLQCPERELPWYFAELRGAAVAYTDAPTPNDRQGQLRYAGEAAAGIRLGPHREWGIGLAYSSGIPVYNSFRSEQFWRPVTLLHVRYQFGTERLQRPRPQLIVDPSCGPLILTQENKTASLGTFFGSCFRPYVFGQLGIGVDRLTLRMARFWLSAKQDCSECVRFLRDLEASGRLPEVDFSLPVSWGIGAGIEYAVTPWMDVAIDLCWRSLAVGEERALLGFQNVPSNRRVNLFLLRAGVTF